MADRNHGIAGLNNSNNNNELCSAQPRLQSYLGVFPPGIEVFDLSTTFESIMIIKNPSAYNLDLSDHAS